MVKANWPTAGAGEGDSVSYVSDSACHIGVPIGVNPGELALVYGTGSFVPDRAEKFDTLKISIKTSKTRFYKPPAASFSQKNNL